jgi:hypothetical protein
MTATAIDATIASTTMIDGTIKSTIGGAMIASTTAIASPVARQQHSCLSDRQNRCEPYAGLAAGDFNI